MNDENITLTIHDIAKVKSNDLPINEKTEIIKCSVTLKSIRAQIDPLIRQLAKNEEEYNDLMDTIPRFYRDYYNSPVMNLYARTYNLDLNGKNHHEFYIEGTPYSVTLDGEAKREGGTYGFQAMMLNHPGGLAMAGSGEWVKQIDNNGKYLICVGDKGITVTKKKGRIQKDTFKFLSTAMDYEFDRERRFYADKDNNGIGEIEQAYKNKEISRQECDDQIHKVMKNHMDNNMDSEAEIATNNFQENGYDLTVYYVPIKKNYEL